MSKRISAVTPVGSRMESTPGADFRLPQPYKNVDLYRGHIVANSYSNADVLNIASDGTTLLGRSDLTGRLWNAVVQVVDSPEALLNTCNSDKKSSYPDIILNNGIADGSFFRDPTKLVLCDDAGDISIYKRSKLWSGVTENNDDESKEAWCISCSRVEHDDAIVAVDIYSSDDKLVTGGADNCIKIWNLELTSLETIRPAHTHMISDIAVNKQSDDVLLSSSLDGTVVLWDTRTLNMSKGKILASMDYGARCVCWLADTTFIVGYESGEIIFYNLAQEKNSICLVTLNYPIHKIVYNERSKCMAICGDSNKICVYHIIDDISVKLTYEDVRHIEYVRDLAWNHTDNNLYSCGWDSRVFKHIINEPTV